MTDERLEMCPSCGHMAHLAGECPADFTDPRSECSCGYEPTLPEAAPLCTACSGRQMVFVQGPNASHPCEHCRGTGIEPAAPSTDEGEARKGHECDAWCVFQSWVSEIRGGASNTDDLGLRSAFDAIAAEAREPLEERIRHLEAQLDEERAFADQYKRHAETGRAEVERLREALRLIDNRISGSRWHTVESHELAGDIIEHVRRATPPSSTEGTE